MQEHQGHCHRWGSQPLVLLKVVHESGEPQLKPGLGLGKAPQECLHGAAALVFQGTIWKPKAVDSWQGLRFTLPGNWSEFSITPLLGNRGSQEEPQLVPATSCFPCPRSAIAAASTQPPLSPAKLGCWLCLALASAPSPQKARHLSPCTQHCPWHVWLRPGSPYNNRQGRS